MNQTQLRKVLAFSSIAHMGWIFSTVGYSLSVGCVMLVIYMVVNSGVFLVAREFGLKSLAHVGRLSYFNYGGRIGLLVGILSLGGLPPLFGFLIKFLSLKCLVEKGGVVLGGILALGSLLSLFFYLRVAFKRALVLFPQHSLVVFRWRTVESGSRGVFTLRGCLLGFSVSFRLLGLFSSPFFISLLG